LISVGGSSSKGVTPSTAIARLRSVGLMRIWLFMTVVTSGFLGFGLTGCSGSSDPVAASAGQFTVAPEATMSPEDRFKFEAEKQKKLDEENKAGKRK